MEPGWGMSNFRGAVAGHSREFVRSMPSTTVKLITPLFDTNLHRVIYSGHALTDAHVTLLSSCAEFNALLVGVSLRLLPLRVAHLGRLFKGLALCFESFDLRWQGCDRLQSHLMVRERDGEICEREGGKLNVLHAAEMYWEVCERYGGLC